MVETTQTFRDLLVAGPKGAVLLPVPDPVAAWGGRPAYHLAGTINRMPFRGVLESADGAWFLRLGPAWRRDCGLAAGDAVEAVLTPEGPQRAALDPDISAALEAEPQAAAFFDEIAQFYRKGYLDWIAATKRSPEKRVERIAEMVRLLKARQKQR
jgi:hypothetical protein